MVTRTRCATVAEALDAIDTLDELEGYVAAIRNPALRTDEPTKDEWNRIAHMRIQMQQRGGRK